MIAVERVKGTQAHPSATQIVIGIVRKTTSIWPEHRHTTHHESERLGDRQKHTAPSRRVVAAPVCSRLATPSESAAANCERPPTRKDGEQGVIGGVADLVTEEIVHLVLRRIVRIAVGSVWRDRAFD